MTIYGFSITLVDEEIYVFREAVEAYLAACEEAMATGANLRPDVGPDQIRSRVGVIEEVVIRIRKPMSEKALLKKKRKHHPWGSMSVEWTSGGVIVGGMGRDIQIVDEALRDYRRACMADFERDLDSPAVPKLDIITRIRTKLWTSNHKAVYGSPPRRGKLLFNEDD
jgi:hypothetical protein